MSEHVNVPITIHRCALCKEVPWVETAQFDDGSRSIRVRCTCGASDFAYELAAGQTPVYRLETVEPIASEKGADSDEGHGAGDVQPSTGEP